MKTTNTEYIDLLIEKFYDAEMESKYGIVGIELEITD